MKGMDGSFQAPAGPGRAARQARFRLAGIMLLAIFVAQPALAPPVQAQSTSRDTVADVIIVGNRNIPTEKIMTYIKTRSGGDYLQATLQADVVRLTDTRMFANVLVR